jgi:CheY-like chemotaxis protein
MSDKNKILVIDDDPDYCSLMAEALSPEFSCVLAYSGEEGLEKFENDCDPVLVILDLNLPGMKGFEICKQLQKFKEQREFAVFIISGDDEIDSKIQGFEAGADDYIAKPFELNELHSRINRSIAYVEGKATLKKEEHSTREMANIAMAQASQYSYVMNFFKSLNHCQDPKQIANLFYEAMSFFNLNSTLQVTLNGEFYFDENLGDVSPIEKSIYELLKNNGRIYEFGRRMIINGRNVAFLIKNFPEDEHAAGQARDFLAALVEGMESKIDELKVKAAIVEATSELSLAIGNINFGLGSHNIVVNNVMGDMIMDISSSYHKLELTDEQEEFFTDMVAKGSVQMSGAECLLKGIQEDLNQVLAKMESISEMSKSSEDNQVDSSDSIDLF